MAAVAKEERAGYVDTKPARCGETYLCRETTGQRSGSTKMSCASCWLMANLALQTWQMKFVWLVTSLIIWSSPSPSSRRRF